MAGCIINKEAKCVDGVQWGALVQLKKTLWGPRGDGVLLDPVLTRVPAPQDCLRGKRTIVCLGVPQTELPARVSEATQYISSWFVPDGSPQSKVVSRSVLVVTVNVIER